MTPSMVSTYHFRHAESKMIRYERKGLVWLIEIRGDKRVGHRCEARGSYCVRTVALPCKCLVGLESFRRSSDVGEHYKAGGGLNGGRV